MTTQQPAGYDEAVKAVHANMSPRAPKERGAVVAMQQKVLRCDLAPAGVGRVRRGRRKQR
jgi:hypothetical protein